MEYTDYLKKYVEGKARKFVREMDDTVPEELKHIREERLISLITDAATPILKGMEDNAIDAACYQITTMIRYSKQNSQERE